MTLEILTKQDLFEMENRMLNKVKEIFEEQLQGGVNAKEWLTEQEAREYLGVSKSTMQNYRRDGVIPFSQYERKINYRLDALQDFLTKNESK